MESVLHDLEAAGNLRQLSEVQTKQKFIGYQSKQFLNLSSNDYLGLTNCDLQEEFLQTIDTSAFLMSNPSSRLMTGNSPSYGQLEATLYSLFGKPALVAGSGYLVNTGILPAVTEKDDLILADKLVHASLIDGLRLSTARWSRFRHNDMDHLEQLLKKADGHYRRIFVVTESVFSMDGDTCPLAQIVELKEKYGFTLYLDEAHAFGTMGTSGCGLAESLGLQSQVDYLVATMGKALASQGAFVICDAVKKAFLVNKMRTLIFSTALPPVSLLWSDFVLCRLPKMTDRREHLRQLATYTRQQLNDSISSSHILPFIVGDNHAALALSEQLRGAGYWVSPVRYPTVPQGTARLRISLTASLTLEEMEHFTQTLKNHANDLAQAGK